MQFEGSDDYARTGDCVYAIKRYENNEWIPTTEPVPIEYAAHRIVIFERYVGKGGGTTGEFSSTKARSKT